MNERDLLDAARGIEPTETTSLKDHVKLVADGASISTVVATVAGWLPEIAALVSIVWGCIRIYETETVRRVVARFKRS